MRPKALYNLLRFNYLKDPSLQVEPWEVEDLHPFSVNTLFERLASLGLSMDEERFLEFAEEEESPEALLDLVWTDEGDLIGAEQAYLLLFELWRKLLPHKKSLSLFCDELDHKIFHYIQDHQYEEMDEILVRLEDVLDTYVDDGASAKRVFKNISDGCAFDLEGFLFEYIQDLIDEDEQLTASELIDGFYEYVSDTKKFEFLRICLFAEVDPQETAILLTELVQSLQGRSNLDLLLSIATFLIPFGQDSLFRTCMEKTFLWIQTEEEFKEVLTLLRDYFLCLDQDKKQKLIDTIVSKRESLNPDHEIDSKDEDIARIKELLAAQPARD